MPKVVGCSAKIITAAITSTTGLDTLETLHNSLLDLRYKLKDQIGGSATVELLFLVVRNEKR